MFEHFTFGAHAQSSYTPDEDTFPSPTDCSFTLDSSPASSCYTVVEAKGGINDIVSQLSSHSLRLDDDDDDDDDDEQPQQSIWHNALPSPDFDNEMADFTPEELSYTSTGRGKVTVPHNSTNSLPNLSSISNPRNGTVACRRLQRQLNVQLQSCNTHIKDISTLVSEMITTSTQCTLHPPSSTISPPFITEPLELDTLDADADEPLPPPVLHEDEGFAEIEDEEMTLRRASTPAGIRKWNVRFRANGDVVGGPPELAWMGRRKVKCVPRMRRRKVKSDVIRTE